MEDDAPAESLPYEDATDASDEELIPCRAPLAVALGGVVVRSAVVLVGGQPGAGKSTEVARLVCALGWRAVYLDAEMEAAEWRALFARVATSPRIERVRRMKADGWTGALQALRDLRPPLAVVDSLHRYADTDAQRLAFLKELRGLARGGMLIFVICQANADGEIAGVTALEHEARATAIVNKESVRGLKCRFGLETTAPRT